MRSTATSHAANLFDGYLQRDGAYDEMVTAAGAPRPHVETLARTLQGLGRHELASRWENAQRGIRDNGVTYGADGETPGGNRRWTLDAMPLLIAPAEWARLESALVQRTRLLNLVLADLYGPQRLLREGLLPVDLVLANPQFLRPCHGIPVPRDVRLQLHAVDLARSSDGEWSILGDRTQAPSGLGYALENRIVLSRTLPEAFRDCRVQRLASFFGELRDALGAIAPGGKTDPRIVLLTPGPQSDTYFEHAYLSRYLGFTLVESGDLTVRERRVFLKTLEGLQQVDVIFRRLDDALCDPLELGAESPSGIAGLVEATRAGAVSIANALGSAVVETPAIAPFLPGLCRHLLGEDLRLPPVPSWWCGQPSALQHVVAHLDQLVIWRTGPQPNRQPMFGRLLTARERSALAAQIQAHPADFVGRQEVALSTAPVWVGDRFEPRPLVLRTYTAGGGASCAVMPGGLTRVAGDRTPIVSIERGGGSKDTWVLSDGPVAPVSLLASGSIQIRREPRASDLPSRVADNLFWLGRSAERVEHRVRLLRSLVACLTQEDTTQETPELSGLLRVLVEADVLPQHLTAQMPLRELERELSFLLKKNPLTGTRQTMRELQRFAGSVRDRLSLDTWRILNRLPRASRVHHGLIHFPDELRYLNNTIADLAAFSGMEMENMTRGHGWRFLDVGRRLERAVNLAQLVRSTVAAGPSEDAMLTSLLEIADSRMTYRSRYFAAPQLAPVLDLLLFDGANARALAFQLAALADHMKQLPHNDHAPSPAPAERLVAGLIDRLSATSPEAVAQDHAEAHGASLRDLLTSVEEDLKALSDTLTDTYFTHAELRVS